MIRLAHHFALRPARFSGRFWRVMVCMLSFARMPAAEAATSAAGKDEAPASPVKSVELLANDTYESREKATRELWVMGEKAMPYLEAAATDADPERARRARILIHKINLGITPDTSPEIVAQVSAYEQAKGQEKIGFLYKLREMNAWKQVLKLYSLETDQSLLGSLRDVVEGVAVVAARVEIAAGRLDEAYSLLELAPADAQGMIGLAAFREAYGVPDSRSAGRFERSERLWQLARLRVAGRYAEAAREAEAAGEPVLAAGMHLLEGDPLPWLQVMPQHGSNPTVQRLYAQLAVRRWSGEEISANAIASIRRSTAGKGNDTFRGVALGALAMLGYGAEVDAAMMDAEESGKWTAFRHFESLERIPDALQVIGLDPANPDFGAFVERKMKAVLTHSGDGESTLRELADMISFLERRGVDNVVQEHFDLGFKTLAEKDADLFLRFVTFLIAEETHGIPATAPVLRCAAAFAGDDDAKWESVVASATHENEVARVWWGWLGEMEPQIARPARLDDLLVLLRLGADPGNHRARLLEMAWKAVDAAKEEDKLDLLRRLADLSISSNDVATGLRALRPFWEKDEGKYVIYYDMFLSAAGEWTECASIWQPLVAKYPIQPELHARLAVALRHIGREAEASEQDRMALRLALGDGQAGDQIAAIYASGGDFELAMLWWKKVMAETKPETQANSAPYTGPWMLALENYGENALREGKWKEAAALGEVIALRTIEVIASRAIATDTVQQIPAAAYRLRLNADLPRAMVWLRKDKPKAMEILRSCHQLLASDGSLADRFFPAMKEAGLRAEHDAWFEDSWGRLTESIKNYPACDNTRNTAAWLAARSVRHLDEAEALERAALKANPSNAAYMDTMADVQFAKGDRAKALEWSQRSLLLDPLDIQIRAQNARFRKAPLPEK